MDNFYSHFCLCRNIARRANHDIVYFTFNHYFRERIMVYIIGIQLAVLNLIISLYQKRRFDFDNFSYYSRERGGDVATLTMTLAFEY